MKLLIGLILFIALCPAAYSQEISPSALALIHEFETKAVRYYAELPETQEESWKILVYQDHHEDRLLLFDADNHSALVETSGGTDRFLSAEIIQSAKSSGALLLTRWSKGVHGEQVRIFDPARKQNQEVFSKTSSWPLRIINDKGHLKISGSGDMDAKTQSPQPFEIVWP